VGSVLTCLTPREGSEPVRASKGDATVPAVSGTLSDADLGNFERRRARQYPLYVLLQMRFTYFAYVALDLDGVSDPAVPAASVSTRKARY
jgi:hypothetical protein